MAAEAAFAQALTLHRAGRTAEAEAGYRSVLATDPGHPNTNNNFAIILRARGDWEEALGCYRRALTRNATDPFVHSNHGCLLLDMGRAAEAEEALRTAITLKPDYAEAHFNLANILRNRGDREGAKAAYGEALRLKPGMAAALCNLGDLHKGAVELARAVECFVAALKADPTSAEAWNNLGETLKEMGRIEEAITIFQKGLEAHPGHALMHSNLLLALHYTPAVPPETIFKAHAVWAQRHADPLLPAGKRYANPREPDRRLRVGYVSPDFCAHSVAFFAEPLIREHDRSRFEVFCYHAATRSDTVTERLKGMADGWRSLAGVDDARAAALIEQERIDILVDLTGHTANNRLTLFARKPAPVQATWLGYPDTTGMRAIDWRLSDAVADPMGEADRLSAERIVRLPHGFHSYRPPVDVGPPAEPPMGANGHVTFGSFNNTSKVTGEVVRVWSEILKRVPGSRLIIKSAQMGDGETRQRYLNSFVQHGIDAGRIDLLARIHAADGHLRAYDRIDIALDPFPYNGTTTTCEALWMGVPVVTVAGNTHVSRVGASLLTHCGLTDLIAADEAGYIATAVDLAGDPERLSVLRQTMRDRLNAAPLTDYRGFAHSVEAAYRAMWRDWMAHPAA
ncbi:tetratricopeptide repeat protein [Azorhizobium sp. AG788]|uniref:O-linked N-acetylglucosamine transferase family protein n=1 Tax=Azorhizobium sp. AG788 TaxID=2183897 RepID=UPI00313A2E90